MPRLSVFDALSRDTAAAAESLSAMMEKERTVHTTCDYLHPPMPHCEAVAITEAARRWVVDWCYGVVDKCLYDRETVAVAMAMVDRFLSSGGADARDALRDRAQFQLVAVAALYVAVKACEKAALGIDLFAAMSLGLYTVAEIEATEMTLLQGLSWRVWAPTSVQTAHYVLSLVLPHVNIEERTWGFLLDEVRFQTEHAARDYYLSVERPSTVAVAAIFNALEQVNNKDRRAVLRGLILVMNDGFASPGVLLAAKSRLKDLVLENEALQDEKGDEEGATVISSASTEVEACTSLKRGAEDSLDHLNEPKKSARFPPSPTAT